MILRAAVLFLVALAMAMLLYKSARAEPVAAAESEDGVRIVIDSEPCWKKGIPLRKATWTAKDGTTYEGCFVPDVRRGLLVFYWDDGSKSEAPIHAFARVHSS